MTTDITPRQLRNALGHLPEGSRRAAVAAVVPSMVAALDAAVAGRRGPLSKVPVAWVPVLLDLLDDDVARTVAAADGRKAALEAVEARGRNCEPRAWTHATANFRSALYRDPGMLARIDVDRADARTRYAGLSEYADMSALWRDHLAPVGRALFDRHLDDEPSLVPSKLPVQWWAERGRIDRAVAKAVWESSWNVEDVCAVLDVAPLTPDAADWVLEDSSDIEGAGHLVLVDRAHATVGGDVYLRDLYDADEAVAALDVLQRPQVRAAVLDAVLDGRAGPLSVGSWDRLVAAGATPGQVAKLVDVSELGDVVVGLDDEQLAEVLEGLDAETVSDLLALVPPGSDFSSRLATLVPATVPGALVAAACEWPDETLAELVMGHVAARLGDDEVAWSQLWSLARHWPGTVDAALACVAACTAP